MLTVETANAILTEVSSISQQLDNHQLASQVVEMIDKYVQVYLVGIFLVDITEQTAVFQAGSGELGQFLVSQGHHIPLDKPSDLAPCLLHGEVHIFEGWSAKSYGCSPSLDIQPDTILRLQLKKEYPDMVAARDLSIYSAKPPDPRWLIYLPLRVNEQVFGVLHCQVKEFARFRLEEVALLQWLADRIAVSLQPKS